MKKSDIIKEIISGGFDKEIESIFLALKERKRSLSQIMALSLNIGDRVKFNKETRPKYLQGLEVTIVDKKRTKLVIELDNPVGRFQGGRITTPASLLEKV